MKNLQRNSTPLHKNQGFSHLAASVLALASVVASANLANAATFSFSFSNENGPVSGTVEGITELPDGDDIFEATSIIVTSAPAALGYTIPLDVLIGASSVFINSFTVVDGMIDAGASFFESSINGSNLFGLNTAFSGGASYLTNINNPDFETVNTGVLDSDSSTLTYSVIIPTTPEPTSLLTLLSVGALGVASKLKKKA